MKRIGTLLICFLLASMALLSGCSTQDAGIENGEKEKAFKAQVTFNGSSTLAPVISKISTSFIENHKTWDKVNKNFPSEDIAIYVSSGGSGAGIKSVIDGTSDFGMISKTVSEEEKGKIEGYQEFKLGVDALTISVNPALEIKDNLSTEEVKKIFSGEYKYWNEVDEKLPHEEIVVVTRDLGGGAHEVFQKSVMNDTNVREDAIQAPSMGALVTKIIENKNAIGYASYGMVNQNEGKIRPLKVDNIEPTKENIVSGEYKISRPLLVVKKGEMREEEKAFIDNLLSEDGMKTVEEMGFVPVK